MVEQWRFIPGYARKYAVSDQGNVRSTKNGLLKPGLSSNGYLTVSLYQDGKAVSHCVQYLVATAFIGARPEGEHVLHRDDNRTNNTLENLRYGTASDNQHDRTRNQRGRKFTHDQIREIRARRKAGETITTLGAEFDCAHNQISYICSRKQYASVD